MTLCVAATPLMATPQEDSHSASSYGEKLDVEKQGRVPVYPLPLLACLLWSRAANVVPSVAEFDDPNLDKEVLELG